MRRPAAAVPMIRVRSAVAAMAAALLSYGLGLGAADGATTCPHANDSSGPFQMTARSTQPAAASEAGYARLVFGWINVARKSHNLATVDDSSLAGEIASDRAGHLARTGRFFHMPLGPVLRQAKASYAGEVLARGVISPQAVVRLWMHSPSHRAVLMSPHPNKLGVGVAITPAGEWLTAGLFLRN